MTVTTTESVRTAWRESAEAMGAREGAPEAYEQLRQAETLLESSDATVSQLERAGDLADEARTAFENAAEA